MSLETLFGERRIAARTSQLETVAAAAERHGATALHLFGSLGRETADALSDIDAWLTFPDDSIEEAVRRRLDLYRDVGDILLIHETAGNRPLGGVYSLALYQTVAGPMQVDWYLAPQRTSRTDPFWTPVYERVAVPRGEWLLDLAVEQEESLDERVSWLICMLFIAVKKIIRGDESAFLEFLGEAFREVSERYRLAGMTVTEPSSLANVGVMLRQLVPYGDEQQRQAIEAIDDFLAVVKRDVLPPYGIPSGILSPDRPHDGVRRA